MAAVVDDSGGGVPRLPWFLEGPSDAARSLRHAFGQTAGDRRNLLLVGENGTGKGLLARAIHEAATAKAVGGGVAPFIEVRLPVSDDRGPHEAFRRRLFGLEPEPGQPAAREARSEGWIHAAQGGTLFLRGLGVERADQGALIRETVERCRTVPATAAAAVQVIAAARVAPARLTDPSPAQAGVGSLGRLISRFEGRCLMVPPLRERLDDLAPLVARLHTRMTRSTSPLLSKDALAVLATYDWPGNLWELAQVVRWLSTQGGEGAPDAAATEKALVAAGASADFSGEPSEAASPVEPGTLSGAVETHLRRYFAWHGEDLPPAGLYARVLREVERPLLEACLGATGGNQIKAAEVLGVNRNTLRKKIKDLGISVQKL
ncbi:MAG: helix-turn-helix domain-containing protein [Alphaproteobacteria bacterium]